MEKIKNYISVKWAIISGIISSILLAWPESAFAVWQAMPDAVKSAIPEKYTPMLGLIIYILSMIARTYQQRKGKINEQNYRDS